MKKIVCLLSCLLFFPTVFALNAKEIVFFGDSLTDNGNLYRHTMKVIPKSPPYFEGRFTNGLTWAEEFALNYATKYQIYAVGGATAVFHRPTTKFVAPTTLTLEIYKYLFDSLMQNRGDNLYVIWIGDNDYMYYQDMDPELGTNDVIEGIVSAIKTLTNYGARHFLVLNLMDSTKTPYIQKNGDAATLKKLIMIHNKKLNHAMANLQNAMPQIQINLLDTFDYYNDILIDPQKYNEQYHLYIADTSTACWQGGFTFSSSQVPEEINSFSPEINYTYQLGESYKAGNVPCENPNQHIFWDEIHPTAVVHYLISRAAINLVG